MELLLGCFVGFFIGATGVGGGLLTAPALMLLFGVAPATSVGTTLAFTTTARLHAGFLYLLRRRIGWRALGSMLLGGVPGALLGPWLLRQFGHHVHTGVLLLTIGIIVIAAAFLTLLSAFLRHIKIGKGRPALLPWVGLTIGTSVGFSSTGAGSLGTMAFFRYTDLDAASVVGTDVVAGLALSATASLAHLGAGSVDGSLLWKIVLGGLPGTFLGVRFGTRIPAGKLRTAVCAWALVLGIILACQGLRQCLS
jgi:hypothetical protein